MTRRMAVLAFLFLLSGIIARANDLIPTDDFTIIIENVGVRDYFIEPLVISTNDAGIERGRAHVTEDLGIHKIDVIQTRIVTAAMMEKLIKTISATHGDGIDAAKSFGTLLFTVLHANSTDQRIVLGKVNAIKLLKSMEAVSQNAPVRKYLAYLRDMVTDVDRGREVAK